MRLPSKRDQRRRRLDFEPLEGRAVPATFGVPWNDPGHLTLSFAPDGTTIAGHTSTLFQALNAQQPTAAWEREVLLAFQTWAVNANINIGLVADGGQPFGISGSSQHDPRFGDIRVGAQPMASDVLSISVPDDPAVSDTLTGDVLLNSADKFGGSGVDVFSVLLHEAGHVFGIGDGTDPKSPLYPQYLDNTKLTPADIATLQSLYGTRSLDLHEGSSGNDTIGKATAIQPPSGNTLTAPLVTYGDISSNKDVDFYSFKVPGGYKGGATIRLQSAGISLLAPHLSIIDSAGHVVAEGLASSGFGDVVTLNLPSVSPNATYYAKVQGATSDAFGIGSYGLAINFDATSKVTTSAIDKVLRGPYQSLGQGAIASIFSSPTLTFFNPAHESDPGTAPTLASAPGYPQNSHFDVIGSIAGPADSAVYRIKPPTPPKGVTSLVLTVSVRAMDVNGTAPRATILDSEGNPIASQILANGGGMFTIQASGLKSGGNYLLKVGPATASGAPSSGNFSLSAQFGTAAAQLSTLAAASTTPTAPARSYSLYVGESQLMHMVLSASPVGATAVPGTAVRLNVLDKAGRVIYTLTAAAGDVVSGPDFLLAPGTYTLSFTALGAAGGPPPALSFRLLGEEISDPIGPVINDPTLTPVFTAPGLPGWFLYPGNVKTQASFLVSPISAI